MTIKVAAGLVVIALTLGIVSLVEWQDNGEAVVSNVYDQPLRQADTLYETHAKPILDKRCVVCHACYDAPCQLKLGSFDGVARGASKKPVYKGDRLLAANLSRLFEDAHSITQWREKDFFPVLNETELSPQSNRQRSLLVKMLEQKQQHPLPEGKLLDKSFDLDLNREWQCAQLDEYQDYRDEYPHWGMPYALPGLDTSEHDTLIRWVEQGAATLGTPALSPSDAQAIARWEAFLNRDDNKHRLVARYLYEHFFIAHLYFSSADGQSPRFFRLHRSTTAPGEPVDIIATRRPFSDPGRSRVYYRFVPVRETIVDKTHMPFLLSEDRLAQYQSWFIDADYQVDSLPGYEARTASNPFVTFADIPVAARYRFMVSEAQYTIMQFIKGPVCRGQIALNVINDHFWVFFAEPSLEVIEHQAAFLSETRDKIVLPAEAESNASPANWITYAEQEKQYLKARSDYLNGALNAGMPLDLSLIWDGDGENDNAALTVFRHYDAASVVKGLVGHRPQTAWVISYPLFERIHYLLVAGYDVYGNLGHQLNSRMYMDFLRMEGEFNFLSLLPKNTRTEVWNQWYRGIVSPVEEYVAAANVLNDDTGVTYTSDKPLTELYDKLRTHVDGALSRRHQLAQGFTSDSVLAALQRLNQLQGDSLAFLPQASFLRLTDRQAQTSHFYTLLHNNAYTNISHMVAEEARRLPAEDTLSVGYGFISSHPNAFFDVAVEELNDFVERIEALQSEQDSQRLFDAYGVRRTSPQFWAFSDALHAYYQQTEPVWFGYFDFNRLENR